MGIAVGTRVAARLVPLGHLGTVKSNLCPDSKAALARWQQRQILELDHSMLGGRSFRLSAQTEDPDTQHWY